MTAMIPCHQYSVLTKHNQGSRSSFAEAYHTMLSCAARCIVLHKNDTSSLLLTLKANDHGDLSELAAAFILFKLLVIWESPSRLLTNDIKHGAWIAADATAAGP
jgi:hypothetical protein